MSGSASKVASNGTFRRGSSDVFARYSGKCAVAPCLRRLVTCRHGALSSRPHHWLQGKSFASALTLPAVLVGSTSRYAGAVGMVFGVNARGDVVVCLLAVLGVAGLHAERRASWFRQDALFGGLQVCVGD